jgi:UDP-N-acetylmuramoyl-tripeptide--D-alanyl-D-alanine ligase
MGFFIVLLLYNTFIFAVIIRHTFMQKVNTALLYQIFQEHSSVTTDTRKIKKGDIFFALKGPNFDGNLYAAKALEEGAAYAVVDNPSLTFNERFLFVEDVLMTLQELAGYYRTTLTIPVIGITGSNGKTTTKELVHAVLSAKFRTSTTAGNLNNHIGIPLTLLRIPKDAEIAVIEMGANHQKEIEHYCRYAKPTHGIITNCGKAHLEGFGGEIGVRKGKGELFDFIKANKGQAFVCSDFGYFHEMVSERKMEQVVWYGTNIAAEVIGSVKKADPFLEVEITTGFEEPLTISTQMVGDYNLYNVLSAVSIGRFFGVSAAQIKRAIEAYSPDNSRSQLIRKEGNTIILDAYNANPSSMAAAIRNYAALEGEKKVLMLGAMAELGEESEEEHKNIIRLIDGYSWYKVILVGGDFAQTRHDYLYFKNAEEAGDWWKCNKEEGLTILLKGSRSTAMEKVLNV